MLPQDRSEATVFIGLAAALIIIWISLFNIRGPGLFYEPQPSLDLQSGEDAIFLRHAMSVEFPTPIDYTPIHSVCMSSPSSNSHSQPGLLFSCEEQHGGVGMVRNQILKCIRYAMHAGASGLVIPSMARRNPKDISDIETSTEVPLENLFDRSAFIEHLSIACPEMKLYNHASDFPSYENIAVPPLSLLGSEFEPNHPRTGLSDPLSWRASFDSHLSALGMEISPLAPIHIQIGQSYLEYPVHNDTLSFISEFGKLLSFRSDTRALAAKVLWQLNEKFELAIDPRKAINEKSFFGAHLRLEKDAVEAWTVEEGWIYSDKERQFGEVWREVRRSGLGVVYVACGEQGIIDEFEEFVALQQQKEQQQLSQGEEEETEEEKEEDLEAPFGRAKPKSKPKEAKNITIVTKYSLLPPHDLARLNALSFDQQALVDFLIMFKSGFFMGVAHSSFPWTVALRRHELSEYREREGERDGEGGGGGGANGDGGYANLGSDILRDEYSVIMGMRRDYPYVDPFEWGLWP